MSFDRKTVPDASADRPLEAAGSRMSWRQATGVWIAGFCLAFFLCRHFFLLPEGRFYANHDNLGYALRLIEFRDCLTHGYMFPQWCSHFRGGLGSPFFNFYQSGYFYAAALVPSALPVNWQLGLPLVFFAATAFAAMYRLIRRTWSSSAAAVAAVAVVAAPYARTNLYLRGDLSEFSAMMCVPACLLALDGWLRRPLCFRSVVFVGMAGAAVVCLHPAIGLMSSGLMLILVVVKSLSDRSVRTLASGLCCLGVAAGLSAVYWLPMFAHMDLVSADQAWDGTSYGGYYHYSRHFNPLISFLDASPTDTPVPIKLGIPVLVGTALAVVMQAIGYRRRSPHQRVQFWCLAGISAAGLFLMTPASSWLWDHLPLLHRIQFPWRMLSVVSVSLAGTVGTAVGCFRGAMTRQAAGLVLLAAVGLPLISRQSPELAEGTYPRDAAGIVERFFAPDIANEWLPKGAVPFRPESLPLEPGFVNGRGRITGYRLAQNELTVTVSASEASVVRLPHYFFPVGWELSTGGDRLGAARGTATLGADENGLMLVSFDAPVEATVRITWQTTGMKFAGAALSALTAVLLAGLAWQRKRKRHDRTS